jgi:hypothetical protein
MSETFKTYIKNKRSVFLEKHLDISIKLNRGTYPGFDRFEDVKELYYILGTLDLLTRLLSESTNRLSLQQVQGQLLTKHASLDQKLDRNQYQTREDKLTDVKEVYFLLGSLGIMEELLLQIEVDEDVDWQTMDDKVLSEYLFTKATAAHRDTIIGELKEDTKRLTSIEHHLLERRGNAFPEEEACIVSCIQVIRKLKFEAM